MDVSIPELGGTLDEALARTPEGRWLAAHAQEYGFSFSYPEGKEALTGYLWEPWHLRWVGTWEASDIFRQGYVNPNNSLTLSGYLSKITWRDCSTVR